VKNVGAVDVGAAASPAAPNAGSAATTPGEGRTRDHVARLILESGPLTAAALAAKLDISPAAIRRHLDALVDDGLLVETDPRPTMRRGRGRPARAYALTDQGRAAFPHAYDDLATTALRYLRETGGEAAVVAFAEHRAKQLENTLAATDGFRPGAAPPEALAGALSAAGYAASTEAASAGTQVCQHHCPVAHVAAEFPELCEAETRAFERLVGSYAQRLATIAHGDGVCTTHFPAGRPEMGHGPAGRPELAIRPAERPQTHTRTEVTG
jgi:predicted ArsR family transcriptional regulator